MLRTMSGSAVPAPRAEAQWTSVHVSLSARRKISWPIGADLTGTVFYTWQRSEGNIEAPDVSSTRIVGIDPYARPAFDFAELVPPRGPLARDRRHNIVGTATMTLDGLRPADSVVASLLPRWSSGEPRAAFLYSDLYGRYVEYLDARGRAGGYSPRAWEMDASVTYHYTIGNGTLRVGALLQNVLNRQTALIDDQRATLGGTTGAVARPNPTFLTPMARLDPFATRLFVRYVF